MVAPAVICKLQYPQAGFVEEEKHILLADCRHHLAKRHVRVLLPGLLAAVVSFWSSSGAGQTCAVVQKGESQGKCANPEAVCNSGGLHGVCTDSGIKGEYECDCKTVPPPPPPPLNCPVSAPLANHLFYIHDLGGGRCIDAGAPQSWSQGSPVFINACNHTNSQEIQIAEIDSNNHDVGLSVYPIQTNAPVSAHLAVTAPTTRGASMGATNAEFCIGVHGGTVAANAALELQTCNPLSPAQRFAVDGDALLMGSQAAGTKVTRDFVIERQNGSTVPHTALVVASRVVPEEEPLSLDARYFRFDAVDGSGAAPTSGFLTVSNQDDLNTAAQCGWGTVVQIDESQPLVLTSLPNPCPPSAGCTAPRGNIEVADGTTIRGYRRQTDNGPQIQTCAVSKTTDWSVFQAGGPAPPKGQATFTGQAVRFTGFRLRGPNGDSGCGKLDVDDSTTQDAIGVSQSRDGSSPLPSVWIDHMETSYWQQGAASGAGLPGFTEIPNTQPGSCAGCGYPDTPIALVVGNFMHDDLYESGSGGPSFVQIRANVFYGAVNQPVTTRQMSCLGGYAAMDNLFLSEVGGKSSDDVDMHGSYPPSHWYDGLTGDYFDVGWNTFLKTNDGIGGNYSANVNQRGYSCRFIEIHNNVFLQPQQSAITDVGNPAVEYGNPPNVQDPTQGPLLVGDFDGDKIDDVFLATGAAWYYSSGGRAEWRYLNRASDPASALLLGDFDGDGRTDVLAVHGPNIDVSWAGVSAWQTINQTAWPVADLAVGDFDGDGRSDLLLATGTEWFLASGGQNWTKWPVSNPDTIPNLRFGHFTDTCGTQTQILRVQKGQWQVTCLSMSSWKPVGAAPVDSMSGLVAGDFDGDGYTDLAESVPNYTDQTFGWQYTSPGHSTSWLPLFGMSSAPVQNLPVGNFQGGKQDGVILWSHNHFYFTHACTTRYPCQQNQLQLLSRQVMR